MNTRIGEGPSILPTYGNQPIDETTGVQPGTGTGVNGQSGPVPNANAAALGNFLQALRNFAPNLAGGDFETRLADITSRMRDTSGEVQTDRVLNEQENKRLNMKENQQKIEEAEKKLEEAEAKKKSGNIFDKIAMAFQALGAILMIALGAVMAAIPGMQAVGALMIAGGVIMAVSLINSIVAELNDGAGILGSIAKAANADPDVIMGLDIAFMAATVIASIALAVLTGGANVAAMAPAFAAKMATAVKTAATAVEIGTSVGSALANVGSTAYGMSAAQDRADAAEMQADSSDIQALMQQLDDIIDQALQLLQQAAQRFNAIADSMTEMLNETGNTVSSTRFTG